MANGIIKIRIENFKKLESFEGSFNCRSVILAGENELGKSSLMQAIFSTLGNEPFPDNSITNGKEKGEIEVEFEIDGRKYIAKRKFTKKEPKGYFEIETDEGLKTKAVSFLDNLVGNISFNPFDFVELSKDSAGRKKQVALLRKLIPAEVNIKIDEVDKLYKQNYDNRTELNRQLKALEAIVAEVSYTEEEMETYKEPVKVEKLTQELKEIQENNKKISDMDASIERTKQEFKAAQEEVEELEKALEKAKQERDNLDSFINDKIDERNKLNIKPSQEIEDKINKSSEHNLKVKEIANYKAQKLELDKQREREEKLTGNIEKCKEQKIKLIQEAGLPVEGLSFDEHGIYLNGMEINEAQVSTSQIMDLGVKISVAINPKLKILRIPQGESLGLKRFQQIKEFAENHGYQLFVEKVEPGNNNLTVRFFED